MPSIGIIIQAVIVCLWCNTLYLFVLVEEKFHFCCVVCMYKLVTAELMLFEIKAVLIVQILCSAGGSFLSYFCVVYKHTHAPS